MEWKFMPNLVQSLFRVDPTDGLVQYVQLVKPYHTKILDVLVEYIYTENVAVTMSERWTWNWDFINENRDTIRECGWGWIWDAPYASESTPSTRIISANAAENYFVVEPITSSTVVGDAIVGFATSAWIVAGDATSHFSLGESFAVSSNGDAASNKSYVVSNIAYDSGTARTTIGVVGGVPLTATASGVIPFASLKKYTWIVTNAKASQLSLAYSSPVVSVNAATKTWVISTPITGLVAGDTIYLTNNTVVSGQDSNRAYTVVSAVPSGSGTAVVVQEYISTFAVGDGDLNVLINSDYCPMWQTGMKLNIHAVSGTLPIPLVSDNSYYFVPTDRIGTFALSHIRYPLEWDDYVHLDGIGSGRFQASRGELFAPGAYVNVLGSTTRSNDRTYGVISSVPDGNNFRVYVRDPITASTIPGLPFDGMMTQQPVRIEQGYVPIYGYDSPQCPAAQASDLFTDTMIKETISIEYTLSLSDYMSTSIFEQRPTGFGIDGFSTDIWSPYGTDAAIGMSGTAITTSNLLLTTGYDTQFFDIGGMDESLETVSGLYNRVL
jgi:hypothetical protein